VDGKYTTVSLIGKKSFCPITTLC